MALLDVTLGRLPSEYLRFSRSFPRDLAVLLSRGRYPDFRRTIFILLSFPALHLGSTVRRSILTLGLQPRYFPFLFLAPTCSYSVLMLLFPSLAFSPCLLQSVLTWRSCTHMWAMTIVAAPSLTLEQRPIFARTLACCRKNALVVRSRFIRGICISGIRGVYKSRCQGDAID